MVSQALTRKKVVLTATHLETADLGAVSQEQEVEIPFGQGYCKCPKAVPRCVPGPARYEAGRLAMPKVSRPGLRQKFGVLRSESIASQQKRSPLSLHAPTSESMHRPLNPATHGLGTTGSTTLRDSEHAEVAGISSCLYSCIHTFWPLQ